MNLSLASAFIVGFRSTQPTAFICKSWFRQLTEYLHILIRTYAIGSKFHR